MDKKEARGKLAELLEQGQSIWLDSISRTSLTGGELQGLIEEGLRGETANPTIFEKAISTGSAYDEEVAELVREGRDAEAIYETLLVKDVGLALDLFRPLYDRLDGRDGFVSLEVSPKLANDTEGTKAEVRRFWKWVNRPNLMVKIPGTPEGIPAIEEMLYEGINVNITLLFAIQAYEKVAQAYVRALERRSAEGKEIGHIASVASFFVSRIDTVVDKRLDELIGQTQDPQKHEELQDLKGRAAIANAKLAYESFGKIFKSARFKKLAKKGARVQRPLWASTSTKNPSFPDTLYVDGLIGPDTINTLPLETIRAFEDHGKVARTVDQGLEGARQVIARLDELGIRIDDVTKQVLQEGVVKFDESLGQLLECLESKRTAVQAGRSERDRAVLGVNERAVDQTLADLVASNFVKKVWSLDANLWSKDPEQQKAIRNRLGWLRVSEAMSARTGELEAFGREVKESGLTQAVLCGMGGSSLGVEVLRSTFGAEASGLDLHVLDTTDPQAIREVEQKLELEKTLFIISSKSGTTAETRAHMDYFFEKLQARLEDKAGENLIVITDPGTPLEAVARERKFRRIFSNPPDIGGRYSVLSFFGLVPAAVMGIDLERILKRAEVMRRSCEPCASPLQNPGLRLGVILGALARAGRDKVTIVANGPVASFGAWAEQLLAESTGKLGKGLVPIAGERLGGPEVYGQDRIFVHLQLEGSPEPEIEAALERLQEAGQPVIDLHLADTFDLGAEFLRWEFATAVAGALLGLNAFDEPNVTESKENTKRVLQEPRGAIAGTPPLRLDSAKLGRSLGEFFEQVREGDYVALMAYVRQSAETEAALQRMRTAIRDRCRVATTLGYGPRFLHSTGQLHKGGPNSVLAFQITAEREEDLSIPGEPYGFARLFQAQSLGDWESLEKHHRRAVRVRLEGDDQIGLLADTVERVLQPAVEPSKQGGRRIQAKGGVTGKKGGAGKKQAGRSGAGGIKAGARGGKETGGKGRARK